MSYLLLYYQARKIADTCGNVGKTRREVEKIRLRKVARREMYTPRAGKKKKKKSALRRQGFGGGTGTVVLRFFLTKGRNV